MDELGFNKIFGAILATALGYMLLKEASHMVIHTEMPKTPSYALELPVEGGAKEEEKPLPFPQATWISAMDADRGARVFKKCVSCHNSENGGNNGTGPNLWNVVGATAGKHAGFAYSSAMSNSGIEWDYESLDGFLKRPNKYLSGTNMNFVGLKKPEDRAAVIEYLRQAADTPIPQPEVAMAEVAVPAELTIPAEDMVIEAEPAPEITEQ